jgi:hypothetical protein
MSSPSDEDDGLVFPSDLGKRRVLVHAEIVKTQPPAGVHVVEVCLKRNHDGFHRSGF